MSSRLSPEQLLRVRHKAEAFHNALVNRAKGKVGGGSREKGAFFAVLFRLAGEVIESDVNGFCDLAEIVFEEIEAFGQEPQLDIDWLGEVVGDRDTFNFSTDNLVSDLVSLPRRKKTTKKLSEEEKKRLRDEVEAAILEEEEPQNFEQAMAVAHGENVQEWIRKINRALRKEGGKADFWTLRKKTKLQPVELLLGILLGQQHWSVRQTEFYGTVTIEAIV